MQHELATLAVLPIEIKCQIASYLPGIDVLHFSQCNRACASIFDDLHVLKASLNWQYVQWGRDNGNLKAIEQCLQKDNEILLRQGGRATNATRAQNLLDRREFQLNILDKRLKSRSRKIRTWQEYAIADSRVFYYCQELAADSHPKLRSPPRQDLRLDDVLGSLPQLFMNKHPSMHSLQLLDALLERVSFLAYKGFEQNTFDARLAFCFCTVLLCQSNPELLHAKRTQDAKIRIEDIFFEVYDFAQASYKLQGRLPQATAQLLTGLFSALLRNAFREYNVRNFSGSPYYTFLLPYAMDFPLYSESSFEYAPPLFQPAMASLPRNDSAISLAALNLKSESIAPGENFSSRSFDKWLGEHLLASTNPNHLPACTNPLGLSEKDKWVGCYASIKLPERVETSPERSNGTMKAKPLQRKLQFEAPITDLNLSLSEMPQLFPGDHKPDKTYTVHGFGRDANNIAFVIDGTLWVRNGHMLINQVYYDVHGRALQRFRWNCAVNPFGISGTHIPANAEQDRVQGMIWLWKEKWTACE